MFNSANPQIEELFLAAAPVLLPFVLSATLGSCQFLLYWWNPIQSKSVELNEICLMVFKIESNQQEQGFLELSILLKIMLQFIYLDLTFLVPRAWGPSVCIEQPPYNPRHRQLLHSGPQLYPWHWGHQRQGHVFDETKQLHNKWQLYPNINVYCAKYEEKNKLSLFVSCSFGHFHIMNHLRPRPDRLADRERGTSPNLQIETAGISCQGISRSIWILADWNFLRLKHALA